MFDAQPTSEVDRMQGFLIKSSLFAAELCGIPVRKWRDDDLFISILQPILSRLH
jgi:hypothetical protein